MVRFSVTGRKETGKTEHRSRLPTVPTVCSSSPPPIFLSNGVYNQIFIPQKTTTGRERSRWQQLRLVIFVFFPPSFGSPFLLRFVQRRETSWGGHFLGALVLVDVSSAAAAAAQSPRMDIQPSSSMRGRDCFFYVLFQQCSRSRSSTRRLPVATGTNDINQRVHRKAAVASRVHSRGPNRAVHRMPAICSVMVYINTIN